MDEAPLAGKIMDAPTRSKTAIFIMPRSSRSWEGAEALWITVAGWATAAKKKIGNAVVVTSDRITQPEEVWNYPIIENDNSSNFKSIYAFLPLFLKTFLNDLLIWKNLRKWDILEKLDVRADQVAFIWEKHDLFVGPGKALAKRLGVPLLSYVHAPVVWEASKWGVQRYFWGKWLERMEARNLKRADLVAVVSEEVRKKVMEMGVPQSKIIISPMAVDPSLFIPEDGEMEVLRDQYGLGGKLVIGWTGSFRKFHGLDHVIRAYFEVQKDLPQLVLMLIGDGAERKRSEALVEKLGLRDKVIFTGRKKFREIPKYISLFDVAVVSARDAEGFHYSPLKLREYMAAGKAVLAPDAGEIPQTFGDGIHLKLFTAGEIESLASGMRYLFQHKERRLEIARNGKLRILSTATWEQELEKASEILKHMK